MECTKNPGALFLGVGISSHPLCKNGDLPGDNHEAPLPVGEMRFILLNLFVVLGGPQDGTHGAKRGLVLKGNVHDAVEVGVGLFAREHNGRGEGVALRRALGWRLGGRAGDVPTRVCQGDVRTRQRHDEGDVFLFVVGFEVFGRPAGLAVQHDDDVEGHVCGGGWCYSKGTPALR
jgi:hypothetical protein